MKKSLLLCALAVPGLAAAADGDLWYVSPFFGGITPDSSRHVDKDPLLLGVDVGKEISDVFNVELELNGANPGNHAPLPSGHLDLDAATINLLAVGNRGGVLSPFFKVGVGAVQADDKLDAGGSQSQTKLGLQAGVGVLFNLWESAEQTSRLSLRPELTLRWSNPGSASYNDFLWTLGFQFAFGGSPVHAPAPAAPPAPPAAPPPPPAPAAAPPPPPPPAPPPPPPMKSSITLTGVNFATDKADLTPGSLPYLDDVAGELKKHPGVKVEIQGHTDSTGSPAHNLSLSDHRASAVRDYLIKDGVPADQLTAKGYGETKPIASNKTKAGRAQNRRTVMEVVDKPADVTVTGEDSTHP